MNVNLFAHNPFPPYHQFPQRAEKVFEHIIKHPEDEFFIRNHSS